MKNSTRYILIAICIIMILLAAGGVVWAFANKFSDKAYADYEDLAGTNTLVNFNQMLKISTVSSGVVKVNDYTIKNNSYTSGYFPATIQSISFLAGHKYYFKGSGDYRLYFDGAGGITQKFNTIYEPNTNTSAYQIFTNVYTLGTFSFNIIDLTQMFGAGNEPNLEQAQEYFNADYYNYNTGTPIPYSKDYLQGYQDGASDLYDSLTVTYNAYTVGASSTTYANNTIERGTLDFDTQYGAYVFTGVIGVNLFANVDMGTNFSIDFELWIPDLQGESSTYYLNFPLHFAYIDNSNNLVDIITITPQSASGLAVKYVGEFVLPVTTSTIYLYVDYNTIGDNFGPTQCIAYQSSMTFKTTDIGLLMNNAYQRGANSIQLKYYPGGEEYNAIYGLGYQNGLAQQNATLGTMEYIGAAFTGLGTILQIELLPGVPFSLFILLPLMFGLITFVIKLSKGGS